MGKFATAEIDQMLTAVIDSFPQKDTFIIQAQGLVQQHETIFVSSV